MSEAHEVPSIHPYLECAAEFIADMKARLAHDPAMLLRQERAMDAILAAILMLWPQCSIKLPCPKAVLAAGFTREAELVERINK